MRLLTGTGSGCQKDSMPPHLHDGANDPAKFRENPPERAQGRVPSTGMVGADVSSRLEEQRFVLPSDRPPHRVRSSRGAFDQESDTPDACTRSVRKQGGVMHLTRARPANCQCQCRSACMSLSRSTYPRESKFQDRVAGSKSRQSNLQKLGWNSSCCAFLS